MKTFVACFLLCWSAMAQEPSEKDLRERFDLAATRATAYFVSVASLERRLDQDGATLHPQLAALRGRIDAAIRQARAAMDKGDRAGAKESLQRAEALLDRLAARIGG